MDNMITLEQYLETLIWSDGVKIAIAKGMHDNEYYYEGKIDEIPFSLVKQYGFYTVLCVYLYKNKLKIRIENTRGLSRYETGIIAKKKGG